jgi:hypothetical protein
MSRPQTQVITSQEINEYVTIDIVGALGLYTVLYKDKPINVKQKYKTVNGPRFKYPKMTYTTSAPAVNLADKLNQQFNCEDFKATRIL